MLLIKLLRQSPRTLLSYRNSGFGDNLLAAANAWYYAKHTGRSLILCWVGSRYAQDVRENAFFQFFGLPGQIQGVPIVVATRVDLLSAWIVAHWHFLVPYPDFVCIAERMLRRSRLLKLLFPGYVPIDGPRGFAFDKRQDKEQRAIYDLNEKKQRLMIATGCYCPQDKLKPFFDALSLRPQHSSRVEDFAEAHFRAKTVIGVHIRYYDSKLPTGNHSRFWTNPEDSLNYCMERIKEATGLSGAANPVIFLSTDSRFVQDFVKTRIPNVVAFEKQFGSDRGMELHQELPLETASASLIEMFLLAKCHILIRYPAESWFSYYASLYVPKIIN